MARLGILNRNRTDNAEDTGAGTTAEPDRPAVAPADTERARVDQARADQAKVDQARADQAAADQAAADGTTTRVVERRAGARAAVPAQETVVEQPRWAHVSGFATLSLIIGLLALCATLTGLLAPVGIAAGVVGAAIAAGGLVGASRRGVTGHSLAVLGLLFSLAAIVLGIMAIGGYLPWLDAKTDEVSRLRGWLDTRLPWLKRW